VKTVFASGYSILIHQMKSFYPFQIPTSPEALGA